MKLLAVNVFRIEQGPRGSRSHPAKQFSTPLELRLGCAACGHWPSASCCCRSHAAGSSARRSPTDSSARIAELEQQVARYLRLLGDWGGLTRYGSADAELGPAKPGDQRVVFIGDDITEAWSASGRFFPGKPYLNRGIARQTTPQMLVRFRQDVIALKPSVVVIQGGTNDVAGITGPGTRGTAVRQPDVDGGARAGSTASASSSHRSCPSAIATRARRRSDRRSASRTSTSGSGRTRRPTTRCTSTTTRRSPKVETSGGRSPATDSCRTRRDTTRWRAWRSGRSRMRRKA